MNLQEIDKKLKLDAKIKEMQLKISQLPDVKNLQFVAAGCKNTLSNFRIEHSTEPMAANVKKDYEYLKQQAELVVNKVEQAENRKKDLQKRLSALKKELSVICYRVTKKDVVQLQTKKDALKVSIKEIQVIIEREEGKNDRVSPNPNHPLSILMAKKESLLADMATGVSVADKALQDIEKKIDEEEQRQSVAVESAINTSQTISGLQAKKAKYELELSLLEKLYFDAFRTFLMTEAEAEGKKFMTLAKELSATFMDIVAIQGIFKDCGIPKNILALGGREFNIPGLGLDSCRVEIGTGYLFQDRYANNLQALKDAKKQLATTGITIPPKCIDHY